MIYLKPPPLEPDPDAIIGAEQNGHETGSNKGSKNGSANGSTSGSSKELTMLPTVKLVSYLDIFLTYIISGSLVLESYLVKENSRLKVPRTADP